jgi:tRNA threonylcarbamoyladenosine biosynthesis protein TsaB
MSQLTPLILSIDTSTPCSAVALTRGTRKNGEVIGSITLSGTVTHSRRLLSTIEWLMRESAVSWEDVEAIGVSLGPGSFTGLRIGMATAKGLAAAGGKMMTGVSTLDSLASKCTRPGLVCALLDARKKEVYGAFYRVNGDGFSERISDVIVCAPEKFAATIDGPAVLIGDGAVVYKELFSQHLGGAVQFAPSHLHEPAAPGLGLLCGELYERGEFLDVGSAVPMYVRSSDAELNLQIKIQKEEASKKIGPQGTGG